MVPPERRSTILAIPGRPSLQGRADGSYALRTDTGQYSVIAIPANEVWTEVCPDQYPIHETVLGAEVQGLDFAFSAQEDCPVLDVAIIADQRRWCAKNFIDIHFANNGSTEANDAYVLLTLGNGSSILSASHPFTQAGNDVYRIELGAVGVGMTGTISITDSITCDGSIGVFHCLSAEIFPQYQCAISNQGPPLKLDVTGTCAADSLRFILQNRGAETTPTQYWILVNGVLIDSVALTIAGNSEVLVAFENNGDAYTLILSNGDSISANDPWWHLQSCGPGAGDFIGQLPTHNIKHKSIICPLIRGSFDPNDKNASPGGWGPLNYILPMSDIQYTIRFENTGNDIAFDVAIVDTIDADVLDANSIRAIHSSHEYAMYMPDTHVVVFTFLNINLPDSSSDKTGSQGYVTFTIKQRSGLVEGTEIRNDAHIYFDNNPPIQTSAYRHTIRTMHSTISTSIQPTAVGITVFPNPTSSFVRIESSIEVHQCTVYDINGRIVGSYRGTSKVPLPDASGLYFLGIETALGVIMRKVSKL